MKIANTYILYLTMLSKHGNEVARFKPYSLEAEGSKIP